MNAIKNDPRDVVRFTIGKKLNFSDKFPEPERDVLGGMVDSTVVVKEVNSASRGSLAAQSAAVLRRPCPELKKISGPTCGPSMREKK